MSETQQHFFQNIHQQTTKFSLNLYEKSPMKSELLVKNAQILDKNINNVVVILDDKVQKALGKYLEKRQAFQQTIMQNKEILQKKLVESPVYKKSNEIQNQIVDSLQNQLDLFYKQFLNNNPDYAKKQEEGNQEEKSSQYQRQLNISDKDRENLINRYKTLIDNVNNISFEVYQVYLLLLQQTSLFKKCQEVKIFQEILTDSFRDYLLKPVQENYVSPALQQILQYRNNGVQYTRQQQQLLVNYYNNQRVLMQQQIDRVLTFIKQDRQKQFEQIKVEFGKVMEFKNKKIQKLQQQYDALKNGCIQVYSDYFTIEFAKEFYQQNKEKIIKQLSELRENLSHITIKGKESYNKALLQFKLNQEYYIEYGKSTVKNTINDCKEKKEQIVNHGKASYEKALNEYKRRKIALYEQKNPL